MITRKQIIKLADLIIDISVEFPNSGTVINYVEQKIKKIISRDNTKFNPLRFDRYIQEQICKKLMDKKLNKNQGG